MSKRTERARTILLPPDAPRVAFPFRANSFSKVTNLFCRFPLPTLFYWWETVNLRNLLRIFVRSRVKIILSLAFSWNNWNKSDRNSSFGFVFLLFQAVLKTIFLKMNLDSKRSRDARDACAPDVALNPFKKKRELFLIFQLSICKYKFNVTIKNIYNARTASVRRLFLGKEILIFFPFESWNVSVDVPFS